VEPGDVGRVSAAKILYEILPISTFGLICLAFVRTIICGLFASYYPGMDANIKGRQQ